MSAKVSIRRRKRHWQRPAGEGVSRVRAESALDLSRLGKQEGQKQQREPSLGHEKTSTLAADSEPCKILAVRARWPDKP